MSNEANVPFNHDPAITSRWQQRFWLEWKLQPHNTTYHLDLQFDLQGTLPEGQVERMLQTLVDHHPALHSRFFERDGQLYRAENPRMPLPFFTYQVDSEAEMQRHLENHHRRPFDLRCEAPCRFVLIQTGDARHRLMICVHHIVMDAHAVILLGQQLPAIWSALQHQRTWEPETPSWPEYLAWEDDLCKEPNYSESLAFWETQLKGATWRVNVPQSGDPNAQDCHLLYADFSEEEPALRDRCKELDVSLFEVLATLWSIVIYRYTGQNELTLAYPLSVKGHALPGIFGCFVNNLPLRISIDETQPVSALLADIRKQRRTQRPHQHVSLSDIVTRLRRNGELTQESDFLNIGYGHNHLRILPLDLEGLLVEPQLPMNYTGLYDTMLDFDVVRGLHARISGRRSVFSADIMGRITQNVRTAIHAFIANPHAPVGTLPIIHAQEQKSRAALETGPAVQRNASDDPVYAFAKHAKTQPNDCALSWNDQRISYGELFERVQHIAGGINAAGASGTVAIWLQPEDSPETMVEAILSLLWAGLGWIPLNPEEADERRLAKIKQAHCGWIIGIHPPKVDLPDHVQWLALSTLRDSAPQPEPSRVDDEAPAYLLFTSGSTGQPKGVQQTRGLLRNLVPWQLNDLPLGSGDCVLQYSPLSFDVSMQELLCSMASGARLALPERGSRQDYGRLLETLRNERVTHLFCPAFALHGLTWASNDRGLPCDHLRWVITAGEQLVVRDTLRAFFVRHPNTRLINQYGPTETHVVSRLQLPNDPHDWPELPSIGTPLPNCSLHIRNAHGAPLPLGSIGELCIGGIHVANGWLDMPSESAQNFQEEEGHRVYRSGDYVRWLENGELEFCGRRDHQIKHRGFRIELGELEAWLSNQPGVRDATAIVHRTHTPNGALKVQSLVVFFRSETDSTEQPLLRQLYSAAENDLPAHMQPRLVPIQAYPLTTSGKVDRRALRTLAGQATPSTEADAFLSEEETLIGTLFAHLLGRTAVGRHDNFFTLGGDSLLVLEVIQAIAKATNVNLEAQSVFDAPTVATLAQRLRTAQGGLPVLQRSEGPPLDATPIPLSGAQEGHWLIHRMGKEYKTSLVRSVDAPFDLESATMSLQRAISESPILHMEVSRQRPEQRYAPGQHPAIPVIRLPSNRDQALDTLHAALRAQLPQAAWNASPYIQPLLAQWTERTFFVCLLTPHVLVDGHSLSLLFDRFAECYRDALEGGEVRPAIHGPSLSDYLKWESKVVTLDLMKRGWRYYEQAFRDDASYLIARSSLSPNTHGHRVSVSPTMTDALRDVAKRQACSIETLFGYAALLTGNAFYQTPRMRSLFARSNRDHPGLEKLQLMLAGALWAENIWRPEESILDGLRRFRDQYRDGQPFGRLPAIMMYAMSRLFVVHGKLKHNPLLRWWYRKKKDTVAGLKAWFQSELLLAELRYRLGQAWRRFRHPSLVRSAGLFVNITSGLTRRPETALPMQSVRFPQEVPESIPGNPYLEVWLDDEGIQVLVQARYQPEWTQALAESYLSVLRHMAEAPETNVRDCTRDVQPIPGPDERPTTM